VEGVGEGGGRERGKRRSAAAMGGGEMGECRGEFVELPQCHVGAIRSRYADPDA